MNGTMGYKRTTSGLVKASFSMLEVKELKVHNGFDIHAEQIKLTNDGKTTHSQILALDADKNITTADRLSDISFSNPIRFEAGLELPLSLPNVGYMSLPRWPSSDQSRSFLRGDGTFEVLLDSDEKLPKGSVSSTGVFMVSDLPSIPFSKITLNSAALQSPPTVAAASSFLNASGAWSNLLTLSGKFDIDKIPLLPLSKVTLNNFPILAPPESETSFLNSAGGWTQLTNTQGHLHPEKLPAHIVVNSISPAQGSHFTINTPHHNSFLYLKANSHIMLEMKATDDGSAKTIYLEADLKATLTRPIRLQSSDPGKHLQVDGSRNYGVRVTGGLDADLLKLTALPTTDPHVVGAIYADSGFLKVSDGGPR